MKTTEKTSQDLLKDKDISERHCFIWHPQREVRELARAKMRREFAQMRYPEFCDLITALKHGCLNNLRAIFEDMLENVSSRDDPHCLKANIEVGIQLNRHLRWICAELGQTTPSAFCARQLVQKARRRSVSGTLMAYGAAPF